MTIASVKANSLRNQIRIALLACFALGNHGAIADVQKQINKNRKKSQKEAAEAGAGTLKIQVAQVRNELFGELGVPKPEVSGRLTKDQIKELQKVIARKPIQAKINKALTALEVDPHTIRQAA